MTTKLAQHSFCYYSPKIFNEIPAAIKAFATVTTLVGGNGGVAQWLERQSSAGELSLPCA